MADYVSEPEYRKQREEQQWWREQDAAQSVPLAPTTDCAVGGSYSPVENCKTTARAPWPERLTIQNIEAAMNYQPWGPLETQAGEIVREALTAAAKAILRMVPDTPFRSVALRNIVEARMNANAAISFRGRF